MTLLSTKSGLICEMPDQGTYKGKPANPDTVKFKTNFQGIPVHVDRPKGFKMSGTTEKGESWTREYKFDYGFIPKTKGGDGDGIDVFIGTSPDAAETYWAVQTKPDGTFDEYKVFLGFDSRDAAIATYRDHIPRRLMKGMITIRIEMMKAMLGIDSDGLIKKTAAMSIVSFFDELGQIQGSYL